MTNNAELMIPVGIGEVSTPEGYLRYLFGGNQGCFYRTILGRDSSGNKLPPRISHHSAAALAVQPFCGVENCFVSMNSYWREKDLKENVGRTKNHLKRLLTAYVDLDYYHMGLSRDEVLEKVHERVETGIIPEPTFVISSGNGMYLVFKLRNEDCRAISRWERVSNYLVDALADVGADGNCRDATRILRVPGTVNGKNGAVVSVLEFADVEYTLYELEKRFSLKPAGKTEGKKKQTAYPYGYATEKQRKYVRDLANRLNLTEEAFPDFSSFEETDRWISAHKGLLRPRKAPCYKVDNHYSLPEYQSMRAITEGWCRDIVALLQSRCGDRMFRETGFFIIRRFLIEQGYTKDQALQRILEWNAALPVPLGEQELVHSTASAESKPYRFKRRTIIKLLGIRPEELRRLPSLRAGSRQTKESRAEANRRAYESKLAAAGKMKKSDAIQARRAAIAALMEQGMTPAEIMKSLNISKATFYRDTAALHAAQTVEKAKRVIGKQITVPVKRGVKSVLRAVKAFAGNVVRSWKSAPGLWLSQKFSNPFIKRCEASLQAYILPGICNTTLAFLGVLESGDRGSGDDSAGGQGGSLPF